MEHTSKGNTATDSGIVHTCSCGWVSRPCFSNAIASVEGMNHRDSEEAHSIERDVQREQRQRY